MWAGIIAFIAAFAPIIKKMCELLVLFIDLQIEHVKIKKRRLENAIKDENEAKAKAKAIEFAKARANVEAFRLIEEAAWKDRYFNILNTIMDKKYELTIKMINKVDVVEINAFLFDEDIDPDYRAVKVINIMKRGIYEEVAHTS